jgi:hypothetical protein
MPVRSRNPSKFGCDIVRHTIGSLTSASRYTKSIKKTMSDGNSQSSRLLPETDAQERPAACYLRYSDSKLAIVVTELPSLDHLQAYPTHI